MKKKIIFRADGNSEIGLGHLYRIFSLVEMLKEIYDFVLLTKETSTKNIIPTDYKVKLIPQNIAIKEEPSWLKSKFNTNENILIADGYQFNSSYQKEIKENGFSLIYIDDLKEEYMYADIVVNHAINSRVIDYSAENYTQFALGSDYAMLRPSFLEAAKKEREISFINSAFVCFGGADEFDFTSKVIENLIGVDFIKKINVIIGGANKNDTAHSLSNKSDKIKLYKNISEEKMCEIMSKSSLGILPTSTVLFEAISIKMYLISGFYVDNQEKEYNELENKGIVKGIGNFKEYNFFELKDTICSIKKEEIRKQIQLQKEVFLGNQKSNFISLLGSLKLVKNGS